MEITDLIKHLQQQLDETGFLELADIEFHVDSEILGEPNPLTEAKFKEYVKTLDSYKDEIIRGLNFAKRCVLSNDGLSIVVLFKKEPEKDIIKQLEQKWNTVFKNIV